MKNTLRVLVAATFILAATPAWSNGTSRSCAGMIASSDGGGLVAFIIGDSGASWWRTFFARARPCG